MSEMELPTSKGKEEVWNAELRQWLSAVRLGDGVTLSPPSLCRDKKHLFEVLTQLNLEGINPEDVVVVCEVGSKLYNLSLPTSDSDYIVIFRHPTDALLSSVRSLKVTLYCCRGEHCKPHCKSRKHKIAEG